MTYTALIFETSYEGHRANYVAILVQALLARDVQVILTVPQDQREVPEYGAFISGLESRLQVMPIPASRKGSALEIAKHNFAQFKQMLRTIRPDHVYIPYCDGLAQIWGSQPLPKRIVPKGTVIEGLVMRGAFAYPAKTVKDAVVAKISFALLRRAAFTHIHFLDPIVHRYIRRFYPNYAKKTSLMPEAIELQNLASMGHAKRQLGISDSSLVVSCPGGVGAWKGTDQLLAAFVKARQQTDLPLVLVLFGKHERRIKDLLKDVYRAELNAGAIVSIDRFANHDEFSWLFAAANVVCVPYPRHIGSASILLRAARSEKSIVASDWGWVGWATKRFHLGISCDVNDTEAFAKSIVQAATRPTGKTGDKFLKRFLEFNSVENHSRHWLRVLNSRQLEASGVSGGNLPSPRLSEN